MRPPSSLGRRAACALLLCAGLLGCSPRRAALRGVADSLSGTSSGGAFARDDDPELVRAAVPFALKTMESLADELDDHVGLRVAMASGFTQYAYAFVQEDADEAADKEPSRARALRQRALRLYLRARDDGLEGLRIAHGITAEQLRKGDAERSRVLGQVRREEVPLLYWTLVPWAAAISLNKRDLALVGDVPVVAALLDRALALDDAYDSGALHEFSLAFDGARPSGTNPEAQKRHYERALELARGVKVSPWVSYAENVAGPSQDKKAFEKLLGDALKFDADDPRARPHRLANLVAQRRARYLLAHESDLISSD